MPLRRCFALCFFLFGCSTKPPALLGDGGTPAADGGVPPAAAWPMYRHDLAHTGRSPHLGPSAPRIRWRWNPAGLPGSGIATECPPVIGADGTLYVSSGAGPGSSLYALSGEGVVLWHTPVAGRCDGSPAIAADGTVMLATGSLNGIGPDGVLRFTFNPTPGELTGSPAIGSDGTIYVSTESAGVYAVNPDGTEKWYFPAASGNKSSPAVAKDGTVYFGADQKIYAVTPSGTKTWEAPLEVSEHLSPMIDGAGRIAAILHDLALFSPEGALVTTIAADAIWSQYPAALASDDSWILGSMSGLAKFSSDGTPAWKIDPTVLVESSVPVIDAEGTIYVADTKCVVKAYDQQGQLRWSFDTMLGTGCRQPILGADRTLYFSAESVGVLAVGD